MRRLMIFWTLFLVLLSTPAYGVAPTLSHKVITQSVGGTGSFSDLMEAIKLVFDSGSSDWRVISTNGSAPYTRIEVGPASGSIPQTRVVFVGQSGAATPTMQSPETGFTTSALYGLIARPSYSSGSWTAPTLSGDWTSGSTLYAGAGVIGFMQLTTADTDFQEVTLWESAETFWLQIKRASGGVYTSAWGALWEAPVSPDNEQDGRIYGVIKSVQFGDGGRWLNNDNTFLANFDSSSAGFRNHAWALRPGTTTVVLVCKTGMYVDSDTGTDYKDQSVNGNRHYTPIWFHWQFDPYWMLGRLREAFVARGQYRTKIQVGGVDYMLFVSMCPTQVCDAVGLKK